MSTDCHLNCVSKLPFLVVIVTGTLTYSVLYTEKESRTGNYVRDLGGHLRILTSKCELAVLTPQKSHHNPEASSHDFP